METVAEVAARESAWQDKAPCRNADNPEIFFPQTRRALQLQGWKVYCNSCPVKRACADSAEKTSVGIYGGEPVNITVAGHTGRPPKSAKKRAARMAPVPPVPPVLFRSALGAVIRQNRQEAGMSLAGLAKRASISISMMSETERGVKEMSSDNFNLVAKALDIKLSELIFEAGILLELEEMKNADA